MTTDQSKLLLAAAMVTMQNMPKADRAPLREACLAFINSVLTEQVRDVEHQRVAYQWRMDNLNTGGYND